MTVRKNPPCSEVRELGEKSKPSAEYFWFAKLAPSLRPPLMPWAYEPTAQKAMIASVKNDFFMIVKGFINTTKVRIFLIITKYRKAQDYNGMAILHHSCPGRTQKNPEVYPPDFL